MYYYQTVATSVTLTAGTTPTESFVAIGSSAHSVSAYTGSVIAFTTYQISAMGS